MTLPTLYLSSDRKTAAMATPNGKQAKVNNAFGLPSGLNFSCPGATGVCENVCYAGKLERLFPAMRARLMDNWNALQNASYLNMVSMLSSMLVAFEANCDKKGAAKYFRIHHDGDFFSRDYAAAWNTVISLFPNTTFWLYTRSFTPAMNVIDILATPNHANLSMYLSVDTDNEEFAADIIRDFPHVRIAALADTFADAAEVIEGIRGTDKPGAKCPELTKQIPLISTKGGACFACNLCPKGKADIRFAVKKR